MVNCAQAISCSLTLVVLHTSVLCLLILRPPSRLLSTLISGKSFRCPAVWSLFLQWWIVIQGFVVIKLLLANSKAINFLQKYSHLQHGF
jgi:hypothetical protein